MDKSLYFPLACVAALVTRAVITGAGVGDALAIAAMGGLFAYLSFLNTKKIIPINESVRQELETLKSTVNALKVARSINRLP